MSGCGCRLEMASEGSKIVHCKLHGAAQAMLDELKEIRRNLPTDGGPFGPQSTVPAMFTPRELRTNISRLLGFLKLDN